MISVYKLAQSRVAEVLPLDRELKDAAPITTFVVVTAVAEVLPLDRELKVL